MTELSLENPEAVAFSSEMLRASLSGLPTPRRDEKLYREVTAAGFAAFPERLGNLNRFKRSQRGETLDYLPIQMDIENVSRCNFRCTMCQVSGWAKGQRSRDMTLDEFKALIDEQYGLIDIKLQGMGEPLMAGDDFFEMIRYARSRHIWVRTTVNGSLLHLHDNYRKLIEADICEAQVSIDGVTKKTYEEIRIGGKFEHVTRNVRMLNDFARQDGRLRTRMWSVVQKSNFCEIEDFPKYAADQGFERLTISLNLTDWGQQHWQERNDRIDAHNDFDAELGMRIVEDGRRRGVEVTFWAVDDRYDTTSKDSLCPWPFERLYVASDMRAVPCCVIANPDIYDLGDARDLTKIWHGPEMQAFRKAHLEGRIPEACQACYREDFGASGSE